MKSLLMSAIGLAALGLATTADADVPTGNKSCSGPMRVNGQSTWVVIEFVGQTARVAVGSTSDFIGTKILPSKFPAAVQQDRGPNLRTPKGNAVLNVAAIGNGLQVTTTDPQWHLTGDPLNCVPIETTAGTPPAGGRS